jgi:FtsZ-binding cell division protein ZapB
MVVFRRDLVERLNSLALLIGSDEWKPERGPEAESLIREAVHWIKVQQIEVDGSKNVINSTTAWNNELRHENERLKKERDEALWRLQDSEKW